MVQLHGNPGPGTKLHLESGVHEPELLSIYATQPASQVLQFEELPYLSTLSSPHLTSLHKDGDATEV